MANQKLSKTPGYINSAANLNALSASSWIQDHDFDQIAEESWMPNQQSGETYHDARSRFTTTRNAAVDVDERSVRGLRENREYRIWQDDTGNASDVVQVSKNQFGISLSAVATSQNRIYYSACPFQVDDNGAITKGSVSSSGNSSGTSVDGDSWHSVGFNNSTSGSINGIPANSASTIWYQRVHWNGNYYMMTWGARFNTSNTVATMDRTTNGDIQDAYPGINNPGGVPIGNWGLTGGQNNTPYYHTVGYNGSQYSQWSRWSYNSGSHPSYNTATTIKTHGDQGSATIPVPQYWSSQWDHLSCYFYHNQSYEFGWGLIGADGARADHSDSLQGAFPKQGRADYFSVLPLRFKNDLVVWLNYETGEYYSGALTAATTQSAGSPLLMTVAARQRMRQVPPNFNGWHYSEKPIRTPVTVGTVTTLYTSCNWQGGFMIKKWTFDTSTNVLDMTYAYAAPRIGKPGDLKFERFRFAGTSENILVNTTVDRGALITVKTYDLSKMFTSLGIS